MHHARSSSFGGIVSVVLAKSAQVSSLVRDDRGRAVERNFLNMDVCGACGVRDLDDHYEESPPLDGLTNDQWALIPEGNLERLYDLPEFELWVYVMLKRFCDGYS